MAYESIQLKKEILIDDIYTIHYFEYMNDFDFPGEKHDFWEFQCVDKGEAEIRTDNGTYILGKGQIIFHRPNEFHTLKASGKTGPNIVVVSFSCSSPCMKYFEKQVFNLSDLERNLMGMLIAEAHRCIRTPLDDPYTEKMELRHDSPPGSQQMIGLYLEQMMIHMLRRLVLTPMSLIPDRSALPTKYAIHYNKVIFYLEEHIRENITVEKICRDNLVGRSLLQKMFKEQHHCGVIEFFSRMKIEFAKQLMRENQMNFTQISDFLGYSSIHYFSRQFKQIAGMPPSEYVSSIKARAEQSPL